MQVEVLRSKLMQIQQAKQTESVKSYLAILKELIDNEVVASFNLRGEEASCALAKIQGMNVALNLEMLYDRTLSAIAQNKIIKP